MAGAHDTEKSFYHAAVCLHYCPGRGGRRAASYTTERPGSKNVQESSGEAEVGETLADRSQKTTVWSFFEPPRHPVAFQNYTRITPQLFDDCPRVRRMTSSDLIRSGANR